MRILALAIVTVAICVLSRETAIAQFKPDQPDLSIDGKLTANLIEEIVKSLREAYVFPETAEKMSEDLRNRLGKMEYDKITSAKELAQTLTDQLQAVSKDKHLHVNYSYLALPPEPKDEGDLLDLTKRQQALARAKAQGESKKFGFEKVECLDGNVGYISLRAFHPAEIGGQAAADAMNTVANTDALIIDLRKNGGGAPSMVTLLCSYLFGPEPVHLNDIYSRTKDATRQWWTLPYLPGTRYEGKPVFLLTSERTFSAAEEFAYNLKNLKRATIVGETTGGGAHPGGRRRLGDHFYMFVPNGRPINPVTKTNWEGTGVAPDIAVPADLALKTAHLAALNALIPVNEARIERIKKTCETLEQEIKVAEHAAK